MKEYIDKAEAIKALTSSADYIADALERLDKIPTEDVAPVIHGKWYYDPDGVDWGLGAWRCDQCGERNNNIGGPKNVNPLRWAGSKFCPNCGSKMF